MGGGTNKTQWRMRCEEEPQPIVLGWLWERGAIVTGREDFEVGVVRKVGENPFRRGEIAAVERTKERGLLKMGPGGGRSKTSA